MRSVGHGIKHLLLAVIWLAALLCITEVAMRAHRWHAAAYPQSDARRGEASRVVVPSAETYLQLRPMLGHFRDHERGGLRTNAFGLRGPEIAIPKPAGVFRVICLGDDTTLARDLPEEQTYCQRLRDYLQERTQLHVEVINAGLPGGCPLSSLLLLRHHLLGLQPDVVLQHVDPTDVDDDRLIRPYTFLDEQGVPLVAIHPSLRDSAAPTLLSLSQEFLLLDWAREGVVDRWNPREAESDRSWDPVEWEMAAEQALSPLAALQSLVSGAYCEVIVTTADDPLRQPVGAVAREDAGIRPISGESEREQPLSLAVYTRRLKMLFMDASEQLRALDASQPPLRIETPEDHELYAALLAEFLVSSVPSVWSAPTDAPNALPSPGDPQPLSDAAPLSPRS